jgi:hypothetical protein
MKDEFEHGMGLPDDELMGESTTTEISGTEVDEGEAGAPVEPSGGRRASGGGRKGPGTPAPLKARPSPGGAARKAAARKKSAPKKAKRKGAAKGASKAASKSARKGSRKSGRGGKAGGKKGGGKKKSGRRR